MKKWMGFVFVLALVLGAQAGYAKVTLESDYQGTVMLTVPEGKVSMLAAGDKIPEIPSQSRLEIFDGSMKVSTEEGDRAVAACLGNDINMSDSGMAEITCKEKEGLLKVLEGKLILKDAQGKSHNLKKGDEQKLNVIAFGVKAPETAAGEEAGSPIDPGINPVDSRSIESSPSR